MSVTLTGHNLKAMLDAFAPDGTDEQLDSEIRIEWLKGGDKYGRDDGYYATDIEDPVEAGCIFLAPKPEHEDE